MKRFFLAAILTLVCGFFSFGDSAKAYTFPHKLNISFTGTHVELIPHVDSDAYDWNVGYKFTIFNAENCKTTIKIQMMHLSGRFMSLSIKDYVGNWPDRTAQDVITPSIPAHTGCILKIRKANAKTFALREPTEPFPKFMIFLLSAKDSFLKKQASAPAA